MKQRNKEHSAYGAEAIVEALTEMLNSGERYVKGSARLSGSRFTFQTEAKGGKIDSSPKNVSELPDKEEIATGDILVVEEIKDKLDSALKASSTKIVEETPSEDKEDSPKPKAKKKKKSK